ncbi:DNA repair exonuclease [Candidatus Pacearchaeota archaeon]|nr:DNA repair exonuclease [Candidatus Pacearchaeota archaeon]
MVKFAHMSDVHLGGWKQEEMQDLNFQSFQKALQVCIDEKVDFVLIAGDLFDTPYPSIEILKKTFAEFRKIHDENIKCFIIGGSHDYSVAGKTFLEVLEKAGFCKNVANFRIEDEKIVLSPTIFNGIVLYGYPGKKTGLDINDLKKVVLDEVEGFRIFMLHTTIDKAKGDLPIEAIDADSLPYADYYAMGHLHIDFNYKNFVYPGPVFPNNFAELETLKCGSFYIVETLGNETKRKKIQLKIKDVEIVDFIATNSNATEEIILELRDRDLNDKVVLLRVRGELENFKNSDIDFKRIEDFAKSKMAYSFLKNTHNLKTKNPDIENEIEQSGDVEAETIKIFSTENPSKFDNLLPVLMNSLSIEKQLGETSDNFSKRIFDESRKILDF